MEASALEVTGNFPVTVTMPPGAMAEFPLAAFTMPVKTGAAVCGCSVAIEMVLVYWLSDSLLSATALVESVTI